MVLDLAVLARWDDGRGSAFCQPVAQGFAVIALVGDEFGGGRHGFDTALGDLAIMDISWCQEQDEGPAFRIADSVELGVAAPLGAVAAHPHAFLLRSRDLVADAFAGDLALELGEGEQHVEGQPPHRCRGVERWVTETKDTFRLSKISTILAKSPSERVSPLPSVSFRPVLPLNPQRLQQTAAGKGMTQVVDAHVVEPGAGSDVSPWVLRRSVRWLPGLSLTSAALSSPCAAPPACWWRIPAPTLHRRGPGAGAPGHRRESRGTA